MASKRGNTNLKLDFPDLFAEWHPTRNGPIDPQHVTHTEHEYWWQCLVHENHVWEATLKMRKRGQGCPFCANKRVCETNSLEACFPEIAAEWHPEKNGDLRPADVVFGSAKNVWWRCSEDPGHEWERKIFLRTRSGLGCPWCNPRVTSLKYFNRSESLGALFPKIAAQWHPTKNGKTTPFDVVPQTQKRFWWKCPAGDDHEWSATVAARHNGGCPCCAGRKLSRDNSFAALFPEVARQWHPTKNGELGPDDVLAGTNTMYWWKCPEGDDHEWRTSCSERQTRGCPFCSGRRVSVTTSLAARYPEIAAEWHPTKNGALDPAKFTYGSKKKVWWQCQRFPEHEWHTTINGRTSRPEGGCPKCVSHTSLAELRIYAEILSMFPGARSRFTELGKELDIYIPEINTGIEYDGAFYHKDREMKDLAKNKLMEDSGVRLIRVREEPLPKLTPDDINVKTGELSKRVMDSIVRQIRPRSQEVERYLELDCFANDEDYRVYVAYLPDPFPEDSLAIKRPEVAAKWDYEKNHPLTPSNFSEWSHKEVHWVCPVSDQHRWSAKISTATRTEAGCPFCSFHRLSDLNRLSMTHPHLVDQWHPTKNGETTPADVSKGSRTKVWWVCEKNSGHEWEAVISSRTTKKAQGCPFCAGKKINHTNSLATHFPEVAREWDHDANHPATPETTAPRSGKRYGWVCHVCGHRWTTPVSSRTGGMGCPECYRRKHQKN